MAVSTVGDYLSALEKSKLLGSEQLVAAQRLAGESSDAAVLAKALVREKLVSRWQAETLLALGPRAQFRLGKYRLIQRLGKGGMGIVFLAEHVTMNRRVALKIVPRTITENRASLDRFFAEARAIAALDHPNIVQAYSVDNEMDRYFIVMEFVDGQDLQRTVEVNGPLDFARAADFIRQAADGLAHAHARNLVHCDIKPSNLLVNQQGVIKILDLGLARLNRSDSPRGAAAGEPAFGTVDYMAPEQGLESSNFDHRADIYSLGCTLYFLLTGHPPFPEGTLAQRIVRHQAQEPRDILLERPDTPPNLVEICKRMMVKEPEKRYQSTQEVSAALASWQTKAGGAAGGRLPLAVKPLDDVIVPSASGDNWLAFLGDASPATTASNGTAAPAAATLTKLTKSGKQPIRKIENRSGFAAALAGVAVFSRTALAWFNTTKRKILGIVGGITLLSAAAGLASLPFLLRHPKPVVQVAVQQPKPEEKKTSVEEDVGTPRDKQPEKKPADAKNPPGKDPSGGKAEPAKKPEHGEEPKTAVPPKSAEPVKPATQPAVKTEVPAKTEANSAKPDVKTTPPDKKAETPATKPDVPAKTPETPPKKAEPPAKPVSLEGLATAVDLQQPGKGAAPELSMGTLDLDPKLSLEVKLLGGEMVAKGNPKFELQKDGDSGNSGWSVEMVDKVKDPVKIARVWRDENRWKVQWTADAKDKAGLLRYCGLRFSCEKKTRFVALSTPKIVAPLWFDLDLGGVKLRLSKDGPLPDPSLLRFQVLPLDASLPKSQTKIMEGKGHGRPSRTKSAEAAPGNKVSAKGQVMVLLTKENTPRVALEIAFDAGPRDVLLQTQTICEISGVPTPFTMQRLQAANTMIMVMEANQGKSGHKPSPEQEKMTKMAKDGVKALAELATELNQKASVPFRVYAALGDDTDETSPRVVIFQSGDVEKTKAGGAKKNTKGNKSKGRAQQPEFEELDLK
jgi:serine/threonine-protein kinase